VAGGVIQANGNSILVGRGFTSDVTNSLAVAWHSAVANVFGPPNAPTASRNLLPVAARPVCRSAEISSTCQSAPRSAAAR